MELKARLKQAAVEGLVLAVKYGVAVTIVLAAAFFVLSDYQKVRNSAVMGENSFRYLEAGVKAGGLPSDWTKQIPATKPAGPVVPAATPLPK